MTLSKTEKQKSYLGLKLFTFCGSPFPKRESLSDILITGVKNIFLLPPSLTPHPSPKHTSCCCIVNPNLQKGISNFPTVDPRDRNICSPLPSHSPHWTMTFSVLHSGHLPTNIIRDEQFPHSSPSPEKTHLLSAKKETMPNVHALKSGNKSYTCTQVQILNHCI